MKLKIEIEDDLTTQYAALIEEHPSLMKEIRNAATQVLMNAREKRQRAVTYLDLYTGNGNLDCGTIPEPLKPEPDALQRHVEAHRRDDKAVGIRNPDVERLLERGEG